MHHVGDAVGSHHHAALAHGFLVDGHVDGVRGNHVQVCILRAYPVFHHVLQFKGVVAELLARLFGVLLVMLQNSLLHARLHGDILVGAGAVFNALPRDGYRRRVVGRAAHLVDIPVCLQVAEVADAGVSPEVFDILVVPQGEGVVVAVGEDDGVTLVLERHEVVLSEVAAGIAA